MQVLRCDESDLVRVYVHVHVPVYVPYRREVPQSPGEVYPDTQLVLWWCQHTGRGRTTTESLSKSSRMTPPHPAAQLHIQNKPAMHTQITTELNTRGHRLYHINDKVFSLMSYFHFLPWQNGPIWGEAAK